MHSVCRTDNISQHKSDVRRAPSERILICRTKTVYDLSTLPTSLKYQLICVLATSEVEQTLNRFLTTKV